MNNKKGFTPIIILLAVVAVLAVAGGVWYYEAHQSQSSSAISTQTTAATSSISPTAISSSTVTNGTTTESTPSNLSANGWVAYSAGGISLKVPATWSVDQTANDYGNLSGASPITADQVTLNWYNGSSATSVQSYLASFDVVQARESSSQKTPSPINEKTITIDGMNAIERYEYVNGGQTEMGYVQGGYKLIAAYVVDNGTAYGFRLGLTGNASDLDTENAFFDEILSTISFNSGNTTNTGLGLLSPNRPTLNETATSVISGDSVTFSWLNALPVSGQVNFFGTSNCVQQITMYDATKNQSFQCGDIDRQVSASGSDTIKFTNSDIQYSHGIQFVLDNGNGHPLTQFIDVEPNAIQVLAPGLGVSVVPGSQYTIRWSAPASVQRVELLLGSCTNGGSECGYTSTIATTTPNTGSYLWTVPNGISGQFKINITTNQSGVFNPSYDVWSDTFEVAASN